MIVLNFPVSLGVLEVSFWKKGSFYILLLHIPKLSMSLNILCISHSRLFQWQTWKTVLKKWWRTICYVVEGCFVDATQVLKRFRKLWPFCLMLILEHGAKNNYILYKDSQLMSVCNPETRRSQDIQTHLHWIWVWDPAIWGEATGVFVANEEQNQGIQDNCRQRRWGRIIRGWYSSRIVKIKNPGPTWNDLLRWP